MQETNENHIDSPIEKLMNEHDILRKTMHHYYEITEEIEYESGPVVIELFEELYPIIVTFEKDLAAHSKKEEEALFPMMRKYLGENDKTIENLEKEHEKAEQHLAEFLSDANKMEWKEDEMEAERITVSAIQAYTTLIQHFANEENTLFPLANKLLSKEDMEMLLKYI